jgi:hypothetical protein
MAITRISCPPVTIGRVVLGPCRLRQSYYRIVSAKGGAGCIEKFDPQSRAWSPAPETVTFADVWSAPSVPLAAVIGSAA